MSSLRLIACDVDGTLLSSFKSVTRQTMNTLRKLQDEGILITLVTGRHHDGITRLIRKLDIKVPVASSNGAVIYDPTERTFTTTHVIPETTTKRILQLLSQSSFPVTVFTPNEVLLQHHPRHPLNRSIKMNFRPRQLMLQYRSIRELNDLKVIRVQQLSEFADRNQIFATNIHIQTGVRHSNEICEDMAAIADGECDVLPTSSSTLTIVPRYVNKASGLAEIAKTIGIKPEQIMAFGDDLNDLDMIRYVGRGVAMGNGHMDLKQLACHVTDSNDKDGIVKALQHFQLL